MFHDSFWGLNGFDELRKYIKQGNEFCKEVGIILQERSELENNYAKALSKLSAKLTKASSGCIGTLASAWSMVATEMETEADLHRSLGQALNEEIQKPMKNLSETQHKTRKPIESSVEKAAKTFADRRTEEVKLKKAAFNYAKDRERYYDLINQSKIGKGKLSSDKDITKLQKKIRQSDELMRKADRDYHESCQKTESARQEWEASVYKGSNQLQILEEERISQMQDFLNKYNSHLSVIGPKLVKCCDRLNEAVISIDTNADLRTVVDQRGTGPNQPEQILLDFYAEDFNHGMDKLRRAECLQNYLISIQQDIERDVKGKEGVEKLMEVYTNRPNFADAEAQEDARLRLIHINAMLALLEACHFKISCAVAHLAGRDYPNSKFSPYIEKTKDKTGMTVSILKLPTSMIMDGVPGPQATAFLRQPADGGQSDSPFEDDDFDDYVSPTVLGQCHAIYDYTACQHDELTIRPGDVINIHTKQDDGWWHGELNGRHGIFPSTYVEETPMSTIGHSHA